jgi:hypothetical protein
MFSVSHRQLSLHIGFFYISFHGQLHMLSDGRSSRSLNGGQAARFRNLNLELGPRNWFAKVNSFDFRNEAIRLFL